VGTEKSALSLTSSARSETEPSSINASQLRDLQQRKVGAGERNAVIVSIIVTLVDNRPDAPAG